MTNPEEEHLIPRGRGNRPSLVRSSTDGRLMSTSPEDHAPSSPSEDESSAGPSSRLWRPRSLSQHQSCPRLPLQDNHGQDRGDDDMSAASDAHFVRRGNLARLRRIFSHRQPLGLELPPALAEPQFPSLRTPRLGAEGGGVASPYYTPDRHHRRRPSQMSGYGFGSIRHDQNKVPERTFYDDFTTIDWTRDAIKDSARRKALESLPGARGKLIRWGDNIQGWIITTIIAFAFALIAFVIDKLEGTLSGFRHGYCSSNWLVPETQCCPKGESFGQCKNWVTWSEFFKSSTKTDNLLLNVGIYLAITMLFAFISVKLTLQTKTVNPLLGEEQYSKPQSGSDTPYSSGSPRSKQKVDPNNSDETLPLLAASSPPKNARVMYTAYGSGVPEVRTILSGFVIRGYLGAKTLAYKSVALVFSVSSGMSLGKEGPFVHLATCVGNIACRLSRKYSENDMKRRQVLSAAASAGVALAFGSPLGGILFSLEEVSYYFLPDQLFRMFFCAVTSAMFLKFMNPYGTGKIVFFEVTYPVNDWRAWEVVIFAFIGVCGGVMGALFCKFHIWWGSTFRQWKPIKASPVLDVMWVAVVTAFVTFPNELLSKAPNEVLYRLASPCSADESELCPTDLSNIPSALATLAYAFVGKALLTCVTFGIKVPSGIYIPSMIVGALFGRMVGLVVQYVEHLYPSITLSRMIIPGFYAMVGAGAVMAGVTRMTVTLAVILFELTSQLGHVIPFSIAILFSNWVANAIEPRSLYELIIQKQEFPFLDNRRILAFDSPLEDLVTILGKDEVLDVSSSPYVKLTHLRAMLSSLQARAQYDGCIPIVSGNMLRGLISAPELEFALDLIEQRSAQIGYTDPIVCKLPVTDEDKERYQDLYRGAVDVESEGGFVQKMPVIRTEDYFAYEGAAEQDAIIAKITDLAPFIDRVPITMDIHSPLSLVQMVFTKLGTRVICVVKDGKFVGILHKKKFIDFSHKD